jgi:adenylate kinase family enzyme
MNLEPKTIIFISRSGGGKGTQISLLKQYFKENNLGETYQLELGDTFRKFFDENTFASSLAKEITHRGELQPSFLAIWAWSTDLIKNLKPEQHLFIDGTPRKVEEEEILIEALDFFNRKNFTVIYINISRECAFQRMSERKRDDDNVDGIQKRLNWFDGDVLPVLDAFKKNSNCKYVEVNGENEIDDIHKEILQKLEI